MTTIPLIADADLKSLLAESSLLTAEEIVLAEKRAEEKEESVAQSILWYGW